MGREVELKFELKGDDAPLVPKLPILADADGSTQQQLTVYYDTRKGQVRREGFSLRVRSTASGFVQTVKRLGSAAALFARDEWEQGVASIEPDPEAIGQTPLARMAASGRLKTLVPVIRSEVSRTSWQVNYRDSVIAFDLDEGRMAAGDASDGFTELELELIRGDAATLVEAARGMFAHVPLRLGVLTKADRGFALADNTLRRYSKAGPVAVAADMSIADGFAQIAQACLKHFRRNEPLIVARRQVEALHQSRVAMRRLRSAFSLFKPVAADAAYDQIRQELRWFTALLGDARNLDVYLTALPQAERPPEMLERREDAYDTIIDALDSPRFLTLMFEIVAWTGTGPWRSRKKANRPLAPFARRRLTRIWEGIDATGDLGAISDEARHELRIQIKKLRYGLEFFRALFEPTKQQKRFFAEVENLQESLGLLNDMVTAQELFAAPEGDPDCVTAETPEQLVEESRRHLRQLRKIGPYW